MNVCVEVRSPDEAVEQENGTPDDSSRAALLMLRPRQSEAIVHVALVVHDGLEQRKPLNSYSNCFF